VKSAQTTNARPALLRSDDPLRIDICSWLFIRKAVRRTGYNRPDGGDVAVTVFLALFRSSAASWQIISVFASFVDSTSAFIFSPSDTPPNNKKLHFSAEKYRQLRSGMFSPRESRAPGPSATGPNLSRPLWTSFRRLCHFRHWHPVMGCSFISVLITRPLNFPTLRDIFDKSIISLASYSEKNIYF